MKNFYKIIIFCLCLTGIGLLFFTGCYIKSKISYAKMKLYQKALVILSCITVVLIFIWLGFFVYGLYEKYYLRKFVIKKPNSLSQKIPIKKAKRVR